MPTFLFFNNIVITAIIIVVTVTPSGPLYIAINKERTINCFISNFLGPFNNWGVIFWGSNDTKRGVTEGEIVSGVNIILISASRNSSSLIVNTTDTSIYGMLINYYRAQ